MEKMTQQQINESILAQLTAIQQKLPNGELVVMAKAMEEMKEDISELKFTLLNPEAGVIVKVNKNTDRTSDHEKRISDLEDEYEHIDDLIKFKETATKVLWTLFTALVGLIVTVYVKGL
jgi:hypothetical protein